MVDSTAKSDAGTKGGDFGKDDSGKELGDDRAPVAVPAEPWGPHRFAMIHIRIARWTAPVLFATSVVFLVCQAILIVIWVDVPSLRENTVALGEPPTNERVTSKIVNDSLPLESLATTQALPVVMPETEPAEIEPAEKAAPRLGPTTPAQRTIERFALGTMFFVWPIVIIETVYHWIIRPKTRAMRWFHFFGVLFCICPSLRMCARSVEMDGRLWLPGMSWRRPDRRLRRRLEQHFSIPMVGIALLILPVLVVEFLLKDQVARYGALRLALHVGTGVIWFAFAAEFILMVSIADKKLTYIRKNWVDLAIIILPFFSFLRSMQAVRGSRLAKLAKIPQLTKLARAYRLRGTVLKAFRALVLLDVSTRLLRTTPEKQLTRLRAELEATQREERLIRFMIARLEREIHEASDPDPDGQ